MNSIIFKKLFLATFFLLIISSQSFAASLEEDAKKECGELLTKGQKYASEGNYPKALEYFAKSEIIGEKYQFNTELFVVKLSTGQAYKNISNFGDALRYYMEALEIAKKTPDLKDKGVVIYDYIGTIYNEEKDYKQSLDYHKRAYIGGKEIKLDVLRLVSGINISDVYNKLGDFKQSQKYLMEIKPLLKSELHKQYWNINYAESLFLEGKVTEARKIVESILKLTDEKNLKREEDDHCYTCIVELLSKIYDNQNNMDLAILYANKGLKHVVQLQKRIDLYEQLSKFHLKKQQPIIAFQYKDSVVLAKDSLSETIKRGLFETNKVKLKIRDYQTEVKHHKENQEAERKLFIVVIILCLLIFFFIYRALKNRIIKQRQEKIISENKKKIIDLELERLKNNVAEKNKKLSAKALYLSGRNELIEEVIDSLNEVPAITLNRNVTNHIKTLKNHLRVDDEWDDFINYFEQVNPNFLKALQSKHPQLTASDIRFICYMYMNLDVKEISTIFNITVEATKKRKQRIAKKMDIDMDTMHEYLLKMT